MRDFVSPRIKAATVDGTRVVVAGDRREKLTVEAVATDVLRVRFAPDGQPRQERTWSVVGDAGDAPREGRLRDSQADAFPDAPDALAVSSGRVATAKLVATVCTEPGEHMHVGFTDVESGYSFASDRANGAYLYDAQPGGSAVRHHMLRADPTISGRSGEAYFGLGESSGALDKAGRRLRIAATDALGYDARTSDPLYKHTPMFIVTTPTPGGASFAYGILYDSQALGTIDLGQEISAFRGSYRSYEAEAGDVDMYLVRGPTVLEVVERLSWLTGRSHPPPRWALGYLGSTMFYTEQDDAQARLRQFGAMCKEHSIPCSAFHLSSGYTSDAGGRRCVFTWHSGRIPDPKGLFDDFHACGMRVLPNIKPWLLCCHPAYAELANRGGLLKRADGTGPLVGRFWSGGAGTSASGSYLDFCSAAGYDWWVQQVREQLLAFGADGAWNDNNEYEVDDDLAVCGDASVGGALSRVGVLGRALQSLLMARASRDALVAAQPDRRPFVISRSGCVGTHRYAQQTWSGDNWTGWATLMYNVPMGLSLGLCGWAGVGHDVGAFAGPRPSRELFVRWVQQGVLQPRFVIHSGFTSDGSCNEPWMYPDVLPLVRAAILLRYRLVPLLHSLHLEAFLHGRPVARPLICHHADGAADGADRPSAESFTYTLGASLLAASVLRPLSDTSAAEDGSGQWHVALPRGAGEGRGGLLGNADQRWCDVETGRWHNGGTTVARAVTLASIPLFVAGGTVRPASEPAPPHAPAQHCRAPGPSPWPHHITRCAAVHSARSDAAGKARCVALPHAHRRHRARRRRARRLARRDGLRTTELSRNLRGDHLR